MEDREGVGGESPEGGQKREEDAREMVDGVTEPPDWLPDGWIWEVRCDDDGEHCEVPHPSHSPKAASLLPSVILLCPSSRFHFTCHTFPLSVINQKIEYQRVSVAPSSSGLLRA